jgi:hypothetical protein
MSLSRLPLSSLIDTASGHLEAYALQRKEHSTAANASPQNMSGIIFSGNPHETVPRRLLLDDRLSPLERNAWQVFRLLINNDGITAFPTYDQLRPYLGMQPGKPASRETISKTLTVLRLTRWLSLGRRVRNDLSGQVQGNVYLLHDEPVSPAEALEFDKDYVQLLGQSMQHSNRTIREVAEIAWREFAADPGLGARLPTRLEAIEERLSNQKWAHEAPQVALPPTEFGIRTMGSCPESALSSESELSKKMDTLTAITPSSESELSKKTLSSDSVRIPNSYSTYTNTNHDVSKSSVPREPAMARWLLALERLPSEQKLKAVEAMQLVPNELKTAVIEQWLHRLESGGVRNPFGYLSTIVKKARSGEFNAAWKPELRSTDSQERTVPQTPAHGAASVPNVASARPEQRSSDSVRTAKEQLSAMQNLISGTRK